MTAYASVSFNPPDVELKITGNRQLSGRWQVTLIGGPQQVDLTGYGTAREWHGLADRLARVAVELDELEPPRPAEAHRIDAS